VFRTYPLAFSPLAGKIVAEYTSGSAPTSPTEQYIFASYVDEPILKDGTGGKVFYHANNLFCVAALSDTSGAVVERTANTPHGVSTTLASDGTTVRQSSSLANSIGYTGRTLDDETQLYQYRHRYYAAELGRFCSQDPIAYESGSANLFCYVYASPLVYVDPEGLYPWGHHLLPQALTKKCEQKFIDKCDEPENRLDNEDYKTHGKDWGTCNGITSRDYNDCILDLCLKKFGKTNICDLEPHQWQEMIDAIKDAPLNSCIGKYNACVEKQIWDDTGKGPDFPLPKPPPRPPRVKYLPPPRTT
jgi:RHS repeat-associated protein